MDIDKETRRVTPPRPKKSPTMRQTIIERLLGMHEETDCLTFVDPTRSQREIGAIVRTIAHQIKIKIITRNDLDGKTVRVWRKL
jgi:hypothetical protein